MIKAVLVYAYETKRTYVYAQSMAAAQASGFITRSAYIDKDAMPGKPPPEVTVTVQW